MDQQPPQHNLVKRPLYLHQCHGKTPNFFGVALNYHEYPFLLLNQGLWVYIWHSLKFLFKIDLLVLFWVQFVNKHWCHHQKSSIQLKNTMKLFLTKCAYLTGGGLPEDSGSIVFEILTLSYILYYLIKNIYMKLVKHRYMHYLSIKKDWSQLHCLTHFFEFF